MTSSRPDGTPARPDARAFPRIQYPSQLRPYLRFGDEVCEVVDCSEQGVRFAGALELPAVGDALAAEITFRDGVTVRVFGSVIRIQGGEAALSLDPAGSIPARVIRFQEALLRM